MAPCHLHTTIETTLLRTAMGLPAPSSAPCCGNPVTADGLGCPARRSCCSSSRSSPSTPARGDPPARARPAELRRQQRLAGGRQPVGALRDLAVDGADGPLAARLYIPSARLGADPVPTLLFLHGGGMALGDLESHDGACRFLAERSGVQVLSVDYRLAPEHPFPAGVEDCFAAYQWMVKNAD